MTTMIPPSPGDDYEYQPPANLDDPYGLKHFATVPPDTPVSNETRGSAMSDVLTEPGIHNPIELRLAETLDVRFPERVVTVRAMPYEEPTNRVIRNGRQITEVVSTGAFGQCERRKDVRAYRGHDKNLSVGRAVALYPDHPSGLIAEVRMAKTALGDETLELAADSLIDVSVGFAPIDQRWSADRTERRITRAFLDHIAFVGDPAYDSATVLDVRSAAAIGDYVELAPASATPNKDAILARLREIGYPSPLTRPEATS